MAEDSRLQNLDETNPIYYIYKASRDVARILGNETAGLEHFFLATVFRNRQAIHENQWDAIISLEVVAEFLEESFKNCENKYSK